MMCLMSHRLIIFSISISLLILKVSVSVIKEKIYQLLIKNITYYIVTQNLCSFISSFFSFIHKNFIHKNYDIDDWIKPELRYKICAFRNDIRKKIIRQ
jgi:hypothetical protein